MTHDKRRYVKSKCDYPGCRKVATIIWRSGIEVYCQHHSDLFREGEKRASEMVRDYNRRQR